MPHYTSSVITTNLPEAFVTELVERPVVCPVELVTWSCNGTMNSPPDDVELKWPEGEVDPCVDGTLSEKIGQQK